jgi:hypothetical protein
VWFDGQQIESMGRERTFVTPELSDARTFEVTATWKNNGRTSLLQEQRDLHRIGRGMKVKADHGISLSSDK